MKNKILLCFSLFCAFTSAQNYTTNFIDLSGTTFRVKFDTNPTMVTMTMVGPSANGYAVGLGMTSMFTAGGDCAFVSGTTVANATLTDRRFSGGAAQPALDSAPNNWTVTSNVVDASGVRTLVATRALNTGDTAGGDFVFTNGPSTLNLIWSLGSSISFPNHSSRGSVTSNFVLANDSFYLAGFNMYPNPADSILAIDLPSEYESVQVQIIDILGKTVVNKSITALDNKLNVNDLVAGTYFVKVSSEDKSYTTKLIIE